MFDIIDLPEAVCSSVSLSADQMQYVIDQMTAYPQPIYDHLVAETGFCPSLVGLMARPTLPFAEVSR